MIYSTKVSIPENKKNDFVAWQGKLNQSIASFKGFISLEILSEITHSPDVDWVIDTRFDTSENFHAWTKSSTFSKLNEELKQISISLSESEITNCDLKGGVTELFVTKVSVDNELRYHEWLSRLHIAEANAPGFKGVFMQSPHKSSTQGENWITLLQFDTPENLDGWLNSPERKVILDEGLGFISSLENHRVESPFAGWFSSLTADGFSVPVWKQTMIILMVLFPIVMLQMEFLKPLLTTWNLSLSTFVSNAISVSLISWPFLPLSISVLGWWLRPKNHKKIYTILGTILMIFIYAIEVIIFWI